MPLEELTGISASVEEVFDRITKTGVSKTDAAVLVGNWIISNAGRGPRMFFYKTDFPATDPDCTAEFARSFVHRDWVDGEDVVQAEETTGEEGFNRRFHSIETDLDSLARDVATAFLCLAELRSSLHALLEELRTEINVVNATLSELGGGGGRPPRPPFVFEGPTTATTVGTFLGATKFFNQDVNIFQTSQGTLMLPAITAVKTDPADNPRVRRVTELGKFLTDDQVVKFFADTGSVSRDAFAEKFGDQELEGGIQVRDVVDILPSSARFTTPQGMLDGLAEREGAALRTSVVEGEAIANSLGVEGEAKIADVPVDRIGSIPTAGRTALVDAGVVKVGDLAGKDPAVVAADLRRRGIDVTTRDVAGWVATAKTFVRVR
jgi:hypothetical protein